MHTLMTDNKLVYLLFLIIIICIIIEIAKIYNKHKIKKGRKALNLQEQMKNELIIENKINENVLKDFNCFLDKYFKLKSSYLRPEDEINVLYILDTFNLGEYCEEFFEALNDKYNINEDNFDEKSRLIDILILMQKFYNNS